MKKLVIKCSNERLITPSGLSLVGTMLGKSDMVKQCNEVSITNKRSQPHIKMAIFFLLTSACSAKAKQSMRMSAKWQKIQTTIR